MKLKDAKFAAIYSGLTSVAKKVYQAIPIQQAWEMRSIIAEVKRLFPSMGDQRMIMGCVDTLVKAGLVQEIKSSPVNYFQRVPVGSDAAVGDCAQDGDEAARVLQPTESAPLETPLEKINGLQKIAARILADMKALSDAIETVAIEVEDQFAARDAESQKLKQLQALLKSLS